MPRKSGQAPPPSEAQVSDAIEALYGIALERTKFPTALRRVDSLIGGGVTFFVRVNVHDPSRMPVIEASHYVGEAWDDYHYRYGPIDPKMPHFRSSRVYDVTVDYDYISEPEIDRHPFYQEFLASHELRYSANVKTWGRHDEICVLSVQRDKIYGHANRREVELLRLLGRHLSQATEIDRRLTLGAVAERSLYDAFDRVPEALFLLGRDGGLLHANTRGQALLRAGDGLAAQRGMLVASVNGGTQVLHKAIAAVLGPLPLTSGGQALALPRPSGNRPLQALIMPLPRAQMITLNQEAGAEARVLMVVSDPECLPAPRAGRLALLFGLTPAESRLAEALVSGHSIADYAEQQGITQNTARWLLKQLREKTDCRRQSDMVRLLATAAAAWPVA